MKLGSPIAKHKYRDRNFYAIMENRSLPGPPGPCIVIYEEGDDKPWLISQYLSSEAMKSLLEELGGGMGREGDSGNLRRLMAALASCDMPKSIEDVEYGEAQLRADVEWIMDNPSLRGCIARPVGKRPSEPTARWNTLISPPEDWMSRNCE